MILKFFTTDKFVANMTKDSRLRAVMICPNADKNQRFHGNIRFTECLS